MLPKCAAQGGDSELHSLPADRPNDESASAHEPHRVFRLRARQHDKRCHQAGHHLCVVAGACAGALYILFRNDRYVSFRNDHRNIDDACSDVETEFHSISSTGMMLLRLTLKALPSGDAWPNRVRHSRVSTFFVCS
eukprot:1088687-Prymnesium_polylepis.3